MSTLSDVLVTFTVPRFICNKRDTLAVAGLRGWDLGHALRLARDGRTDTWTGSVLLPPDAEVEYKLVVLNRRGIARQWEDGYNSRLLPRGHGCGVRVLKPFNELAVVSPRDQWFVPDDAGEWVQVNTNSVDQLEDDVRGAYMLRREDPLPPLGTELIYRPRYLSFDLRARRGCSSLTSVWNARTASFCPYRVCIVPVEDDTEEFVAVASHCGCPDGVLAISRVDNHGLFASFAAARSGRAPDPGATEDWYFLGANDYASDCLSPGDRFNPIAIATDGMPPVSAPAASHNLNVHDAAGRGREPRLFASHASCVGFPCCAGDAAGVMPEGASIVVLSRVVVGRSRVVGADAVVCDPSAVYPAYLIYTAPPTVPTPPVLVSL